MCPCMGRRVINMMIYTAVQHGETDCVFIQRIAYALQCCPNPNNSGQHQRREYSIEVYADFGGSIPDRD